MPPQSTSSAGESRNRTPNNPSRPSSLSYSNSLSRLRSGGESRNRAPSNLSRPGKGSNPVSSGPSTCKSCEEAGRNDIADRGLCSSSGASYTKSAELSSVAASFPRGDVPATTPPAPKPMPLRATMAGVTAMTGAATTTTPKTTAPAVTGFLDGYFKSFLGRALHPVVSHGWKSLFSDRKGVIRDDESVVDFDASLLSGVCVTN